MRIAILACGSRGDIQPMLTVGDELRGRGHSVVITVNPNLATWARRSGLEIVEIEPDYEEFFRTPEGKNMLARGEVSTLIKEMTARERGANTQMIRALIEASTGADLIVSTTITCDRGDALAEKLRIPHGMLFTFPVHTTGDFAHVFLPVRHLGLGILNRASFDLVYSLYWRDARPNIQELRAALDLPPRTNRADVERCPAALAVSEAVLRRPADWGEHIQMTGFVTVPPHLRERLGEGALPPGLEQWLDAGDPPIFCGFGSMPVLDSPAMLAQIAEVTARRRVRALIAAGWTDYGPGQKALPEHLHIAPAFDHDRVLPRCRAAIHHGGAGTTAAVLRAGLPSLVAPVFGDQPFWGWRVEQLGVGLTLPFRKLSAARIDRALDSLLTDSMRSRVRAISASLAHEQGAKRAADAIEGWARRTGTVLTK